MDSPLRKLVWMIVAVAAMILLAPMAASAHEGHHAGVAPHAPVQRFYASDHRCPAAIAETCTEAIALTSAWSPASSDAPCAGGCCVGMVCCPSAIFSQVPALDPPPEDASQTFPRTPPLFAGLRASALLEPPNALT